MLYQVKLRWNISSGCSLDVPCSPVPEQPWGRAQKGRGRGEEGENGTWISVLGIFPVSDTWSDQPFKSSTRPLDRGMMFHFIGEETEPQFSLTELVAHSYEVARCSYGTQNQGSSVRSGAFHDLTLPPFIPSSFLFFPSSLPLSLLSFLLSLLR